MSSTMGRVRGLICLGFAACTGAPRSPSALRLGTTYTVQQSGALALLDSLWRGPPPVAAGIRPSGPGLQAPAPGGLGPLLTHPPTPQERLLVHPRPPAARRRAQRLRPRRPAHLHSAHRPAPACPVHGRHPAAQPVHVVCDPISERSERGEGRALRPMDAGTVARGPPRPAAAGRHAGLRAPIPDGRRQLYGAAYRVTVRT